MNRLLESMLAGGAMFLILCYNKFALYKIVMALMNEMSPAS